jgi:hypothetical protein
MTNLHPEEEVRVDRLGLVEADPLVQRHVVEAAERRDERERAKVGRRRVDPQLVRHLVVVARRARAALHELALEHAERRDLLQLRTQTTQTASHNQGATAKGATQRRARGEPRSRREVSTVTPRRLSSPRAPREGLAVL